MIRRGKKNLSIRNWQRCQNQKWVEVAVGRGKTLQMSPRMDQNVSWRAETPEGEPGKSLRFCTTPKKKGNLIKDRVERGMANNYCLTLITSGCPVRNRGRTTFQLWIEMCSFATETRLTLAITRTVSSGRETNWTARMTGCDFPV